MPFTNFPNGVTSFGIPLLGGARFSNPWATHYFVDGDDGSDGHNGKTPDRAFKTIQKAIDVATAGDVIYIRPKLYTVGTGFSRYTEDVTITSGLDGTTMKNANISLIGITPRGAPTDYLGVRWKHVATHLTNSAPGLHVEGIGFFGEGATKFVNLVTDGDVEHLGGTGTSFYNCAFKGNAKLYAAGADELQIVNCRFQAKYDGSVGGIQLVGSAIAIKRPVIRGCEFIGGNANNMSGPCIVGAAVWYDAVVRDNYFNADPDGSIYINIAGSTSTGIISNNHFGVADISTGRIVEGGLLVTGAYDGGGLATGS